MLYLKRSVRREEELLQIIRSLYERKFTQQESRVIQNRDSTRNDRKFQHLIQKEGIIQEENLIQKESWENLQSQLKRVLHAEGDTEKQIEEILYQLERKSLPEEFYLTEEERWEMSQQISRLIHTQETKHQRQRLELELWEDDNFGRNHISVNSRNAWGSIQKILYLKRSIRREGELLQMIQNLYERKLSQQEDRVIQNRDSIENDQKFEHFIQKENLIQEEGWKNLQSQLKRELLLLTEKHTEKQIEEILYQLERKNLPEEFYLTEEERRETSQQISRLIYTWGRKYQRQGQGLEFCEDGNFDRNHIISVDSLNARGSIQKMLYLKRSVRGEEELLQMIRKLYERKLSQQENSVIQSRDSIQNDQKLEHLIEKKSIVRKENLIQEESWEDLQSQLKKDLLLLTEKDTEKQIEEILYQLERKSLPEEFYLTEEERRETSQQISRIIHTQETKHQRQGLELEFWEDANLGRNHQIRDSLNAWGSIQKMLYLKRSVRGEEELLQMIRKLYGRKLSQQENSVIQSRDSIQNDQKLEHLIEKESIVRKENLIQEESWENLQRQLKKELLLLTEKDTEKQIEEILYQLERKNLPEEFYLTGEERREASQQISCLILVQERKYQRQGLELGLREDGDLGRNHQSRNSRNVWGSIQKILYLKRSVRGEEELLQIIRNLYERKISQQENLIRKESWENLQRQLKKELLLLTEKDTEKQIEEILYQLERKNLPEEFYLPEEERRETSQQISRLILAQERKYQRQGLELGLWEDGDLGRNHQIRDSRNVWGRIQKMLYLKRSVRREEELVEIFQNLYEKKLSQHIQEESLKSLQNQLRINRLFWDGGQRESKPKTEFRILKNKLSEYTTTQKAENQRIVNTQMELRKEQTHFRSRQDRIVQKERAAENVLLKKETVLVQKSVEEQENRIHVLQEELRRQKKEMETLAGKISGSHTASTVNPERVTEQILREMQKQFRLEKMRRGM